MPLVTQMFEIASVTFNLTIRIPNFNVLFYQICLIAQSILSHR